MSSVSFTSSLAVSAFTKSAMRRSAAARNSRDSLDAMSAK